MVNLAKFYQTKEFRELEKRWDKILTETGFMDAERTKNGQRILAQNSSNAYRQACHQTREDRAEYFRALCYHFHRTNFDRLLDQRVMMFFSDGLSIKQIVKTLTELGQPIHRQTIRFIIRRFEHDCGIRFWSMKDRNLKDG